MSVPEMLERRVWPIEKALQRILVGQRNVIRRVTMALFAVGQRDFYPDGTRFLGTGHVLCEGGVGTGKCLGKGTPVLMFDGTIIPVESVKTGDLLMGPDSLPRKVIALGHGFGELYRVIPKKGDSYVVNDEHILSFKMTSRGRNRQGNFPRSGDNVPGMIYNMSVKEYLGRSERFKSHAKGYRVGIEFDERIVPLDPYFFGVWLGDGISRTAQVCNTDNEIIAYIRKMANKYRLRFNTYTASGKAPIHSLWGKKFHPNAILSALREMNVLQNKHVPQIYKANSRRVRLQILAGLMDTDGSLSAGCYDFVNKSKQLADDVVYLARSLGFAAYVKPCTKVCKNNGKKGRYYRVSISGNLSEVPVRIAKKKASLRRQKKNVLVTGIKVEPEGYGEYFGFEIEGPDRLFLLGDFTVTHNTVLCKALSRLLAGNSKRVSGMPDALASDITGCEIILLTGDTKTVQGPLFCNVMLADEINRFPPKAQNAFIEALAEGCVTIANETIRLKQPFFCLATQNPTEQKGTSRLQEALSDRFMFKLVMRETTEQEKIDIAKRTHHFDVTNLNPVITTDEVYEAREYFFNNTHVSDEVRRYAARLLRAINHPAEYKLLEKERALLAGDNIFKQKPAVNDRAMLHMEGAAMMEAVMSGRDYVIPADVAAVAADALRARLLLSESSLHLLAELHPGKTETELVDYFIDETLSRVRHT